MEGMMSEEYEQLLDMLEKYEAAGNSRLGPIPEELQVCATAAAEQQKQQNISTLLSSVQLTPYFLACVANTDTLHFQELMANVKRAKGQQAAAQQESTQEVTPQPG